MGFLFNIDGGYLEGLCRGFKCGILKQSDYLNLVQCETLEGELKIECHADIEQNVTTSMLGSWAVQLSHFNNQSKPASLIEIKKNLHYFSLMIRHMIRVCNQQRIFLSP